MLSARGQQRLVFGSVVASTLLMAIVALAHFIVDAQRVFGFYEPLEVRGLTFLAPLLNPNNLGGFMAIGVPVLIGFSFEQREPRRRLALLAAIALLLAVTFMTRSRGAVGAVALGPALYGLIAMFRTRDPAALQGARGPRWQRYSTPVGVAIVLSLGLWAWFDELVAEFQHSGWDKIDLIAIAARFASTVPWVGVGRGAFSSTFVNTMQAEYRFDYAENLPVQWAADWGLPMAVALGAGLSWLWLTGALRARSAGAAGFGRRCRRARHRGNGTNILERNSQRKLRVQGCVQASYAVRPDPFPSPIATSPS